MTKTSTTVDTTSANETKLSAKVNKAIDAIRAPFVAFGKDYAALTVKRNELAPLFMKAFTLWATETGGSFVDFARYLDPSIPAGREGYRAHRGFQAADYLRRLAANASRADDADDSGTDETAATPAIAIARLMASVLPLVEETSLPTLWAAIGDELNWTVGQVTRLQARTADAAPLVEIKAPHGHAKAVGHMRIVIPAEESATEHRKAA